MAGETVFYRGPSGTTIDGAAMEAELAALGFSLNLTRRSDRSPAPIAGDHYFKVMGRGDDPCTATLMRGAVPVSSESFPARERAEGLARLLRRNLPEPAKVIAHMSDVEWESFQGSKAEIA